MMSGGNSLAVASGGDVFATCSSNLASSLRLWDSRSWAPLAPAPNRTSSAADADRCVFAIGVGAALDPQGLGDGLSWQRLLW
mmetsp:Transcript_34133/g.98428  ORF Transcript_34133/g.98428 Transcript_34133/m.98428 type:complete len:82 (+) Transcript_34133:399-644(+)